MKYMLETHYGECSLADEETGIVLTWKKGKFNETQDVYFEGTVFPKKNPEIWLAGKLREMGDWAANNCEELI